MTTQAAGAANTFISDTKRTNHEAERAVAAPEVKDTTEVPSEIAVMAPVELRKERALGRSLYATGFMLVVAGTVLVLNPDRVQTDGLIDLSTETAGGSLSLILGSFVMGISKRFR